MPSLDVRGLIVRYGRLTAVHGIDLHLAEGEVAVMLGSNGAGKSSTLNAISGAVPIAGGRVHFGERDITGKRAHVVARAGLVQVPEGRRIIAPLSVEPFNFNKYAELGKFAISGYLYFGLGTRLWPGFVVQQRVEFLQTGYFGVIQRVRGTYAYITRTSREWIRIIDEQSYVLDVERDATDYINQRQKVRAGIITTVRFQDAPGIELDGLLKKSPGTVGVEIDAAFETYFVFNPSSTGDPNLDMNTIWYPVGQPIAWKAAARIELAGDDPWEPAAWRFVSNACNVYPSVMAPFPTWTGRVQNSVREEGARSLRLILNEEMP